MQSLELASIPYSRFDPGNEVARAYLTEPESVLRNFAVDYRDPRALKPLLDAPRLRPPLTDLLQEYNAQVGGSVDNARRLEDGFCVISGQQVGLLLGPAYTTYKLFTVINAARRLEEELGVPVVPVFWVESEDHDWDEVNRFFLDGRKLRLQTGTAAGTPIRRVEADPAPFLAEVKQALGDGDAWSLVEPAENEPARWHVRNLARLVAGSGVVFIEPYLLREPMRETAGRIAAAPEELDASLQRDTGFARRLDPPAGGYFFDGTPPRKRSQRGASLPERWSSDVAVRVLIQNAALPVLAAVCGPGEIDYWAQLKQAHEAFGIPMPAVLPRDAATLVEPAAARDAARLGVALDDAACGVEQLPEAGGGDPVAAGLRKLAAEAGELTAALEQGTLDLPANTDKPFRRTVKRMEEDLERLAGRLDDARRDEAGVGHKRFERLMTALRPRGQPQERTVSLFPFLLRHGPQLAQQLQAAFDPYEFGHYLVRL